MSENECICVVFRFDLPGINAMNFVLHKALGGGGIASLRSDPQVITQKAQHNVPVTSLAIKKVCHWFQAVTEWSTVQDHCKLLLKNKTPSSVNSDTNLIRN